MASDLPECDYLCLICPLPDCYEGLCPRGRLEALRRREARARAQGRDWLSERQVRCMAAELAKPAHENKTDVL